MEVARAIYIAMALVSIVPLILFNCVTYGEIKGREYPIENFKCYYRSDRFKFYIDQVRKDKFEK